MLNYKKAFKGLLLAALCAMLLLSAAACGASGGDATALPSVSAEATLAPTVAPASTLSAEATAIAAVATTDPLIPSAAPEETPEPQESAPPEEAPEPERTETPKPTAAPTATPKPTAKPTPKPTAKPTVAPTKKPVDQNELTVTGKGVGTTSFTLSELKALGAKTVTYTGRNKEQNNERQFSEYTGVPIKTLLKACGWDGSSKKLKLTCSDGYTATYRINDINGLYAFKDADGSGCSEVPAMIAFLSEGDYVGNDRFYSSSNGLPYRLVYGQEDYDSAELMDFNMQGWALYVKTIELV